MLVGIVFLVLSLMGQADLESQGSAALDRGDYATAEKIFTELAAKDSKDIDALFNLALSEAGQRKDQSAIDHFKQTLVLRPKLFQAEQNLAMLYLRNHRNEEAVPVLKSALEAKPDRADLHLELAQALAGLEHWAEAIPEFEAAAERDAKNAQAQLGWGLSLQNAGKLDDAEAHYRRAVELDASLKPALFNYAAALASAGKTERAIPLFEQFPENAEAHNRLGEIYLTSNQFPKAVSEFEAAAQLAPGELKRLSLATAYLKAGQEAKAAPLLKEALAAAPNDWELQLTVGRIYRDQKQFAAAGNYFLNATKLKPDAPEAWSELAGVLTMMEQYGPALGALDKLHQLNAEKPGHLFLRAIILDKLRQIKPALASYEAFLKVSDGQNPDQEFQARGRVKALAHEVNRR